MGGEGETSGVIASNIDEGSEPTERNSKENKDGNKDGVDAPLGDAEENANGETKEETAAGNNPTTCGNNNLTPPILDGGALQSQQSQRQMQQPCVYPYNLFLPAYGYPGKQIPGQVLTGQTPLNPHQYTDLAHCQDPCRDTRRNRGGVTQAFPEKLHEMLDGAERDGKSDIVSWLSHGRSMAIHRPRLFVKEILPKYFKQNKLTSFQRQLNLYGFKRLSQGPDNGSYWHELFLKGRPGLCVNMKRTKVRGTKKQKRDPASEPNFYAYPPTGSQAPVTTPPQPVIQTGPILAANSPPAAGSTHTTSYQALQYYPFINQLPMIAPRVHGPYTAAQQPAVPVYPIPPKQYTCSPHGAVTESGLPHCKDLKGGTDAVLSERTSLSVGDGAASIDKEQV